MNDEDNKVPSLAPAQIGSEKRYYRPGMSMGVFAKLVSTICIVMLTALYVICWKMTGGAWPNGIKLYGLLGVILFFVIVRYLARRSRLTALVQSQQLNGLQMLIVVVGGLVFSAFLIWFFEG